MINRQKELIQEEALNSWIKNNKIGTLQIITGLGKTFIAFKAMLSMPKNSNCLFLSESTVNLAA